MVTSLAFANSLPDVHVAEMPKDEVQWCTVSLSDVIDAGKRLEASVFEVKGTHARESIENCKYGVLPLYGDNSFSSAYTCGRFKRTWLPYSDLPIYQPSSILDIKPTPDGYLSHRTKTDIEALRVRKGQILVTCSGTIGKVALVSKTLDGCIFSHDLIRVDVVDPVDVGFVYAFLCSDVGNTLLQTNRYGAVIQHIEPHHLADIPVPNPPNEIKEKISELIFHSYELRDQSNELIDKATKMLVDALDLPHIDKFQTEQFNTNCEVNNYCIKLSELDGRLDGSYHIPLAKAITEHLKKHAGELLTVGHEKISSKITLAGIFKRIYVDKNHGIPFLGGREITQLTPQVDKYLSISHHKERYEKELKVFENDILITDRGTIATVVMVPKHFEGYAVSQNVLKLVPANNEVAGYIYIYLNSEWGRTLICRQTYGSVVDMIDDKSLSYVEIPMLKDFETQKEINRLAIEANAMRYKAYILEQEALKIMNDEVIFA